MNIREWFNRHFDRKEHTMTNKEHTMSKADMINAILGAMQSAYNAEGVDVEGDFGLFALQHYYEDKASMDELLADYEKWCYQLSASS